MFSRFSSKQLVLINRYYRMTGFYAFLRSTAYRAGITIAIFAAIIIVLELYVLDINAMLNLLVVSYSPQIIFAFFLASETVLGLIPPEFFIAWASKSITPWLFLFLLATLSYVGGIISYFIGDRLFLIPAIKNYIQLKIARHITNLQKWGGFFVVLGAVSPIPHSVVSLACGLIRYNFKHYLLWALFRYVRFTVYALVIFKIL